MGHRILIVEDDPAIADYLVRGLREEGYTVEHAAEGEDGWHRLKAGGWNAIVLDWWLPGIDGLTLLRRFRNAGHATPVLLLTARDAVPDRVRGLDAGADGYLTKPFAFDEMIARIRALVRRPGLAGSTLLRVADVTLDIVTQAVLRNGKPIDLTAKEYALLTYLLRHPAEVLTRTRIYEQVWDERYDGTSNTLEVHVVELRRKLEAHGPRLIHTLRGRGYRFAETPATEPA